MNSERRTLLLQTAAIVVGTIVTVAAVALPAIDSRYAKSRDVDRLVDELRGVRVALDSTNLRLTQIICAQRVQLGCR